MVVNGMNSISHSSYQWEGHWGGGEGEKLYIVGEGGVLGDMTHFDSIFHYEKVVFDTFMTI